jgi:RHS repeat-associated protein
MTTDTDSRTFIYDGENKQVEVKNSSNQTIGQYTYDGDGKRIKKYVPDTGETTIFVYDAAGKQIAEYSSIVANSTDAKVAYLTNDHLGSPRINTDSNGAVTSRHDYHPFGEEIATSQRVTALGYSGDTVRKQFTGYERDDETDLDFAEARYYAHSLGRFASPDEPFADQLEHLPQTWNLYAYSRNNPLRYSDPTGRSPFWEKVFNWLRYGIAETDQQIEQRKQDSIAYLKSVEAEYGGIYYTGPDGITQRIDIDHLGTAGAMSWAVYWRNQIENGNTYILTPREASDADRNGPITTPGILSGNVSPSNVNPGFPRLPVPATPNNMSQAKFGELMGWGSKKQALDRIETITKEEMIRKGVTKQMAEQWRDFYLNEAKRVPGNQSAMPRAQLMQKVVDLLSK